MFSLKKQNSFVFGFRFQRKVSCCYLIVYVVSSEINISGNNPINRISDISKIKSNFIEREIAIVDFEDSFKNIEIITRK